MSGQPPRLLLASRPCGQCLVTRDRIVPGVRAAALVRKCREERVQFVCHKGTLAGLNIHCRGVHDAIGPALAYDFAVAVGIPIVELDPDGFDLEPGDNEGKTNECPN